MNKVASYLQSHISGEVLISERILDRFSRDASILTVKPNIVVYPRTTNDVRKVARFTWQLAERGHVMPVTARGNGTDLTGAAIGRGVIMSFPAHLNKILELDTKQKLVRVQPGVNFKSLQETLQTHGLFLPPAPESQEYSTIGGAIANNAAGVRSQKYGDMRDWVDRLEVVLANGEVIQTGPLSKKELSKKLGLPTLEGELYRAVDTALTDGEVAIDEYQKSLHVSADNVGYDLQRVRKKNGDINLTPLFVGSQGTLGIITEAIIRVENFVPQSSLSVISFATIDDALEAAEKIALLKPSVLELIDGGLFTFVKKQNNIVLPDELLIQGEIPAVVLFVENDDPIPRRRVKFTKQVTKITSVSTDQNISTEDYDEKEKLWSYRHATSVYMSYVFGAKAATPLIENISVPVASLHQFLQDAKELCAKHHLETATWLQIPSGCVTIMPLIDLTKLGDRQHAFKLMEDYFRLVVKLGGSIAASSGEGRLRAPLVALQVSEEVMSLNQQVKTAADPHATLNPGVKLGTNSKELVDMLRKSYSFEDFADYLPRL